MRKCKRRPSAARAALVAFIWNFAIWADHASCGDYYLSALRILSPSRHEQREDARCAFRTLHWTWSRTGSRSRAAKKPWINLSRPRVFPPPLIAPITKSLDNPRRAIHFHDSFHFFSLPLLATIANDKPREWAWRISVPSSHARRIKEKTPIDSEIGGSDAFFISLYFPIAAYFNCPASERDVFSRARKSTLRESCRVNHQQDVLCVSCHILFFPAALPPPPRILVISNIGLDKLNFFLSYSLRIENARMMSARLVISDCWPAINCSLTIDKYQPSRWSLTPDTRCSETSSRLVHFKIRSTSSFSFYNRDCLKIYYVFSSFKGIIL